MPRPRFGKDRVQRVGLTLHKAQCTWLENKARQHGCSRSEIIRKLITAARRNEDKTR